MKTSCLILKNQAFAKLLFITIFAVILTGIKNTQSLAQQNEYLCTKGLTYGELVGLFQLSDRDKLKRVLGQKCFKEIESSLFSVYERRYEKTIGNEIHTYNEFFRLMLDKAYEYQCSELNLCYNLLKQINDDAIFYNWVEDDTYMYILKDQTHVLEMRDIPDQSIGYGYGFKLRPVTTYDLDKLES